MRASVPRALAILAATAWLAAPHHARAVMFNPESATLANGLQVIAVPHHEQPSVAMRLMVRAGAAQDPEKRAGVAYLIVSGLLLNGLVNLANQTFSVRNGITPCALNAIYRRVSSSSMPRSRVRT